MCCLCLCSSSKLCSSLWCLRSRSISISYFNAFSLAMRIFRFFLYLSISDLFARLPEKELINQYFQWQGTQNQPNRGNILMLCCAIICLYENGKTIMLLKWWKISMIAAAIWGSQRSSSLMKRSRHLCPALNMALSSSSFSSILSDLPSLSSFPLLSSLSSSSISSSLSSSSYQKPTCYIPHRHLLIRTTWSFQKYLYHNYVRCLSNPWSYVQTTEKIIILIYTIIAIAPTPWDCRKRLLNSKIATSVNVNLVHAPKEAGNFGESRWIWILLASSVIKIWDPAIF